jgi:hypothetical protein
MIQVACSRSSQAHRAVVGKVEKSLARAKPSVCEKRVMILQSLEFAREVCDF